jgi:Cu/Zn superoxide dismutase
VNLSGPESVIGRCVVIHLGVDDCGIYQNQRDPSGQLTQLAIDSGENGNAGIRTLY